MLRPRKSIDTFSPRGNNTMKAQPFVVTPKDYDPALNVLGIKVTVLASNTATQAYEITRQQGEKGMGPPPHSHNWDESFYVVAGEMATQMFTAVSREIPPGPPEIPKLLEVLNQNGVTVQA